MVDGNKPEKKFRAGVISATIWKNNGTSKKTGEPVEFNTIQLDRRYTDKEGNWQSTGSLRINDIPKATACLQKAFEYLIFKSSEKKPAVAGTEPQQEEVVI